jgi:hypothetical protein
VGAPDFGKLGGINAEMGGVASAGSGDDVWTVPEQA